MSLAKAMLRLHSRHEFSLLLNSRLPNENLIRAEFADLMPTRLDLRNGAQLNEWLAQIYANSRR